MALITYGRRSTGDSTHKVPVMPSIVFPLLLPWTNCWRNGQVVDDLRRHNAHVNSLQWTLNTVNQYLHTLVWVIRIIRTSQIIEHLSCLQLTIWFDMLNMWYNICIVNCYIIWMRYHLYYHYHYYHYYFYHNYNYNHHYHYYYGQNEECVGYKTITKLLSTSISFSKLIWISVFKEKPMLN